MEPQRLICISMITKDFEHLSGSHPIKILLLRILCLVLSLIFNQVIWANSIYLSSLLILDTSPLSDNRVIEDIFSRLPICPIDSVHCLTEALKFLEVPLKDC